MKKLNAALIYLAGFVAISLPANLDAWGRANPLIGTWRPMTNACSNALMIVTAGRWIAHGAGDISRTGYPPDNTDQRVRFRESEPGHWWIFVNGQPSAGSEMIVIDANHITPGRATGCTYARAR